MSNESQNKDNFIMETLIKISKDVGEIKTKVEGLEKSKEKDNKAFEKRLETVEEQTKKNTDSIVALQNADDKKDAKNYRSILRLVGAGVTGVIIAKFPDIVKFFIALFSTN